MDNVLCPGETAKWSIRMGADDGFTLPQLGVGRRGAMERNRSERTIFVQRHGAEVGLAYAGRVFQHRVEYRLKLARRAADDLEHLRRRRLLLQCLAQIARAMLFRVEQPNVPDRNHRLISERLQQRNLALGELSSVGSCNRDRSNGVAVKQQRHCHDASIGYRLGETQGTVGGIRLYVRDLGDSAVQYRAADSRVLARWPRKYPPKGFQPLSAQTMTASKVQEIAVEPHHEGELATAQPYCALGNRVEHRLDVSRRARDDAQDLGGGGLLLQRLGQVPPRLGKLTGARPKLLLELARVRLELLFRRS